MRKADDNLFGRLRVKCEEAEHIQCTCIMLQTWLLRPWSTLLPSNEGLTFLVWYHFIDLIMLTNGLEFSLLI